MRRPRDLIGRNSVTVCSFAKCIASLLHYYTFDRVPRKMIKKSLPKVIVKGMKNLYHGVKTKARVGSESPKEFCVQAGAPQESVSLPLIFAIATDVITEYARKGVRIEILHTNGLV